MDLITKLKNREQFGNQPDDGGNMFFQNADDQLPDYKVSQPRKTQYTGNIYHLTICDKSNHSQVHIHCKYIAHD
jgi:hypothetical protein